MGPGLTPRRGLCGVAAVVVAAAACASDPATPQQTAPDADAGPEEDTGEPCEGCVGAACDEHEDCYSGWCVEGPDGHECVSSCEGSCPPGWECKGVQAAGPDLAFVCIYAHLTWCAPCHDDGDCTHPLVSGLGSRCLEAPDGVGSFCATACAAGDDTWCPAGASCVEAEVDDVVRSLCVPDDGTCECSWWADERAASTTCAVSNDQGSCAGARSCAAGGLSACDAATPLAETCNGADDDCDGETDESFSELGQPCDGDDEDDCADGVWQCGGPAGGDAPGVICTDDAAAGVEVCNGVDDNCDGLTDGEDEDLAAPACEQQAGVCAGTTKPPTFCVAGAWLPCDVGLYSAMAKEGPYQDGVEASCDGVDNDCDGGTDEDFVVALPSGDVVEGPGVPCGEGNCDGGVTVCNEAGDGLECSSITVVTPEVCNGVDDDCDGLVDALDADLVLVGCELDQGVCEGATKPASLCVEGAWLACDDLLYSAWSAAWEAGSETWCDGLDNDCDGAPDDDFAAVTADGEEVQGAGTPCGVGACAGGALVCDAAGTGVECSTAQHAGAEVCDGVDDDCDGLTDAADPDLAGTPCELQGGVCAGATRPPSLCVGGAWQACGAALYAEHAGDGLYEDQIEASCDGLDNDCDGATDEDFVTATPDGVLVKGAGEACGAGVCAGGVTACNDHADGIVCPALANGGFEVCDGLDNDCDGATDATDDSLTLVPCDNQKGVCGGAVRPAARCVVGSWEPCTPGDYEGYTVLYEVAVEETCDGLDNDCDGGVDEDFSAITPDGSVVTGAGKPCGAGSCEGGATVCTADGSGVECSTDALPAAEVCDGVDNDCDGLTDAADPGLVAVPCDLHVGVCAGASRPASLCEGGAWQPCGAGVYEGHDTSYEDGLEASCDGQDNDCDGATDEDFAVTTLAGDEVAGVGQPCGTGACGGGITACDAAGQGVVCTSEPAAGVGAEVCNGADDDCDGVTDFGDPDLELAPCEAQDGVCGGTVHLPDACVGGAWLPCSEEVYAAQAPDFEAGFELSCDGADNDCDGAEDEDFSLALPDGAVVAGVGAACGVGVCAGGVTFCDASGAGILCSSGVAAAAEQCDGLDNDCDGLTDAFDPSLVQAPCEQQAGACAGALHPTLLCTGGQWGVCPEVVYGLHDPAYQPGAETACDAVDNDCDGGTDEDFSWQGADGAVVTGAGASCGVGACAGGATTCNPQKTGVVCSTAGNATPEVCAAGGQDDDCDGLVDAADPDLQPVPCASQQGVCSGAMAPAELCVGGAWLACGGEVYGAWAPGTYEGGAEASCDGLDNDCDGAIDDDFEVTGPDGVTVAGAGKPCGAGICAGGVTQCAPGGGAVICTTADKAGAEVCDTLDNDCDGAADAADGDLQLVPCEQQAGVCEGAEKPPKLCVGGVWAPCATPEYASQAPGYQSGDELSCDGLDNDCDGATDEAFVYVDADGAEAAVGGECGLGLCAGGLVVCADPKSATCSSLGDAAPEVCDGVDQDCDGAVDDGCDDDGDGWCDEDLSFVGASPACPQGAGDCDDQEGSTHPEALEPCNLVDDDCDGSTDEDFVGCPGATCAGGAGGWFATGAAACEDGGCVTPPPASCGLHACAGDVCGAECGGDEDCVAAAHCVEGSGGCVPDVADGGPCEEPSDCQSGHCQNGSCCADGDCCSQPADCPAGWAAEPACDEVATCQGSRLDAVCVNHMCASSAPLPDDTACGPGLQAQDCAPFLPVFCTGAKDQTAPICAETCASDVECLEGFHCDGTCQLDVGDGGPCDEDSDCSSEHCQGDFCCVDGDCCAAASDCPEGYSAPPICEDAVTCQGSRVDATCDDAMCGSAGVDDDSACDAGVEAQGCGPFVAVYCAGGEGQAPPQCPLTCAVDAQCDAAAHCDGTCVVDVPDGGGCDEASDCLSGHCEGGLCCAPGGDCCNAPADCPEGYGAAATCDFKATCQGTKDKAICVGHVCATQPDVADDSACTTAVEAKGCGPFPAVYCAGGVAQDEPLCADGCGGHGDCDVAAWCDGAVCQPDLPDGGSCGEDAQCVSGHCQNGFCCGGGDCCAAAANCPAALYAEPAACLDASQCAGERRDPVCLTHTCQLGPTVPYDSACAGQEASNCGYFPSVQCSAAVDQEAPPCPNACGGDAQCDPGAHCDGGVCVPDVGTGSECDEPSDCADGLHCADGVCCTTSCGGTCQRCDLPTSPGTCTPVAAGDDPDSECGGVSCVGYYWGFDANACYRRADVPAAEAACNGFGSCQAASDLCPSQEQGTASLVCHPTCQVPGGGTCVGTTPGSCTNVSGGQVTCGLGECEVTTAACQNGLPASCQPAPKADEVCNGLDDDCDGLTDAADPVDLLVHDLRACEDQDGVCAGCDKPAGLCQGAQWKSCGSSQYAACSAWYQPGVESSCDGLDNDCDGTADDDFQSDVGHCGSCNHPCTNPHGDVACAGGSCVPTCDSGYKSCDGDPDDGCETSITSLTNCGNCGVGCALTNAGESCASGACLITSCSNGWCNQDGLHPNGCEYDLDTSPACGIYTNIGSVRGDTGSDTSSHTAHQEKYLRFFVSEGHSNAFSCVDLKAKLTLTVGAGTDYDLEAWCDGCSTSPVASSSNGGTSTDSVIVRWDEKCSFLGTPTGSDSGRYLYARIKFASGNTCANWSLTVQGNPSGGSNTCGSK